MTGTDWLWALALGLAVGGAQVATYAICNVLSGQKWNEGL